MSLLLRVRHRLLHPLARLPHLKFLESFTPAVGHTQVRLPFSLSQHEADAL